MVPQWSLSWYCLGWRCPPLSCFTVVLSFCFPLKCAFWSPSPLLGWLGSLLRLEVTHHLFSFFPTRWCSILVLKFCPRLSPHFIWPNKFPCLYLFLILLPQWKKHCMIWMLKEVYYIIFTKQNCFGGLFVCLLFVSSVCPPVGCATSLQTISRWIVWAITNMLVLFALYPFERIPLGYNHHLQHSKEVSFCWRTVRPQLSPQRTCSSAQFCVGSLVLSPMWDYTENRKWKQHCSYL